MRLTVLGGSAAGTNSGQGCSGYLVESAATTIVLDLGPGTLLELRKHTNFRTLSALVISHMHVDHIADLLALRFALAYNPVPPPAPIPLWLPPGGEKILERLAAVIAGPGRAADFWESVFELSEFEPGRGLAIGDVRLSFLPTVHFIPCWAIRVAQPSSTIGDLTYTADAGPATDLAPFAAGSTVLLAESTYLESPPEPFETLGHLTAGEAGSLASSAGVSTLILTHIWEEVGFDRYLTQAAQQFSGRIELARPGLYVEW